VLNEVLLRVAEIKGNIMKFHVNVLVKVDPEENFLPIDGLNEDAVADVIRALLYDVDGLIIENIEVREK
jgi:hypothetical protein|tara:strand:- start:226 stop:432 length:207 start_codon:yes stop_codon:yes gene_type:complete